MSETTQNHQAKRETIEHNLAEPDEAITLKGTGEFKVGGRRYRVLTAKERREAMQEYIRHSMHAFRPSYLADKTGFEKEVFSALVKLHEEANDAILALVEHSIGLDALVAEVIKDDGFGSYLSTYDGDELEISHPDTGHTYYAYQT